MTPRERASKLAKDMVYAYEVCATMKDLDGVVHAWTMLAEKAITAAIEEEEEEDSGFVWPKNEVRQVKGKLGETRIRPPFTISDENDDSDTTE